MPVEVITRESAALARALVMTHGRNATAYQILNPGIERWFTAAEDAVVGYTESGNWFLVAGEPVCEPHRLSAVAHGFEAFAREQGRKVCYVLASEWLRERLRSKDYAAVSLGAQPVWNPMEWGATVRARRSFRAQLNRSVNKGVAIAEIAPDGACRDFGIQRTLQEWLRTRSLPPMRFLVEPDVLSGVIRDRLLFTARHCGRIVAFLVASPVPARNGYLIEELARSPRAPNGTSELLIDAAMRRFAGSGCDYATMGLVALAAGSTRDNPLWLRTLMSIARAHANRFYNFRGLERFRSKMQPREWERLYAVSNERFFSPQALYAIGGAFSGISPVRAILIAIAKGARHELRTASNHLNRLIVSR